MNTHDNTPLRLLIVGGHPADVFDNAGGTLLHHIQQGDSVTALCLTHGARIHDVVISDALRKRKTTPPARQLKKLIAERTAVKRREIIDACGLFGIRDVRFLTYDDLVLLPNEPMILEMARLIRRIRPDIVITHYPYDNGGLADQHAVTGQMVLNAASSAGSVDPGDRNPPHRVVQMFFMGTPSLFFRSNALVREFSAYCDVYVDISDVIHLKIEALDKLKSQQYDGVYARKRVEAVDGNVGMSVGLSYAEPFIACFPEVSCTLPLSAFLRTRAREPESDTMQRMGYLVTRDGQIKSYKRRTSITPQRKA